MAVIILIGEQGSGKGTVSKYLETHYGALNLRSAQALSDILDRLGISDERKNLIALVKALRKTFGEDVLARALAAQIQNNSEKLSVVEGIRMPEEITLLKKLPDCHLWYVTAPIEMRYEKVKRRGEKVNEGNLSFEEFEHVEKTSVTENHIPEMAKNAEVVLENIGTLEALYKKVDAAVKDLNK